MAWIIPEEDDRILAENAEDIGRRLKEERRMERIQKAVEILEQFCTPSSAREIAEELEFEGRLK